MHTERFVRALVVAPRWFKYRRCRAVHAERPYRHAAERSGVYSGRLKVDYPTPYELARPQDVRALLERIHAYVSEAAPIRVVNGETGEAVTDLAKLPPQVALARTDLQIVTYEWGVTYAGMLLLSQVTGDARYRQYTDERVTAIARLAAHARRQLPPGTTAANYPRPAYGIPLRGMLLPARLDDGGAMCAALIKAQRAGLGANTLQPWIDNWLAWVHTKQFRLADGTLARNRPLPNTLWLDDLYMSVPCLAQAGKLTGEARYYDDAAKQVLQFADRMFVKEKKLFMHAWNQEMDYHPAFHWARANGWAIMAMAELLDVLPESHPARARVLALYRQHAEGSSPPRVMRASGTSCSTGRSRTRRLRPAPCTCSRWRGASTAAGSMPRPSGRRCRSAGTRSRRR
jgi:hypothetical protein